MNVDFGPRLSQIVAAIADRQDLWLAAADGVLKATLVLGVALVLDVVLRRWAVACVTMWNATLVGLVALAIAETTLPKSDLLRRWLPTTAAAGRPAAVEAQTLRMPVLETPVAQPEPPMIVETSPPEVRYVAPPSPPLPIVEPDFPMMAEVPAPIVPAATAPVDSTATWFSPVNAIVAAVAIYLLGLTIAVWRLAAGLWAVAKLRRAGVPPTDDDWHQRLAKWAEKLELRRTIELCVSDAVSVPLVVGARRPMIVVPTDVAEQTAGASRDAVLVHELTHVARCDYAWQLLLRGLQTVLWFHPLIWVAERRISFIRERVCDAYSVHGLGSVDQYADALLEMAGRLAKRCSLSLGLAVVRSSKLGERLAAIHEHGGSGRYVASRWGRTFAAAAALGIAALLGRTGVTPIFAGGPPKVDEAAAIVAEFEASIVEIRRDAESHFNAQRGKAVTVLLALQEEYSQAAKLDEAVAIRDAIRRLQAARPDVSRTADEAAVRQRVIANLDLQIAPPPTTTETINAIVMSSPPAPVETGELNINLFGRPATSVLELWKIMAEGGVFNDERRDVANTLLERLTVLFARYENMKNVYGAKHPKMIETQQEILEVAATIYGLCEYASTGPSRPKVTPPSLEPTDPQGPQRVDQNLNKPR